MYKTVKKIRKFSAAVIAVLLVATMLAGCGQDKAGSEDSTVKTSEGTAQSTSTASGEQLDEVTIKMLFAGDKKPFEDEVWANVERMSKNVLNAKFEINRIAWGDYADKIKMLAASGDDYDVHFDANWLVWPILVKNGTVMELDELMDQYAPGLKKYMEDKGFLEWAKVNGKVMAIPYRRPSVQRAYAIIREDLRKKYDIPDSMATIEELENYLDIVTKNEKGIKPVNGVFKGGNNWDNVMSAMATKYNLDREFGQTNFDFTYDLNDSKVTIVPLEQTQAFKEGVKIKREWYEKGWIPKNAINMEEKVSGLDEGKYAACIRSTEDAYKPMNGPGEKKGYAMYPDSKSSISGSMGNCMVFNKNAANPERAMMFMEWVNASQENYDAVLYGIKDKTYVLKEENGVQTVQYPDGQDNNTGYLDWHSRWMFWRDSLMRPGTDGGVQLFSAMKADTENENNINPPVAGFTFNTEPVKNELSKRQAVMDDYGKILIYGLEKDVDKAVETYIAKAKEAGTDKIVAELQKQIDEFLANK